jgi:hypothetical protein
MLAGLWRLPASPDSAAYNFPMSKLYKEILQGTAEARAYMEGEREGYRVTLPEAVNVCGLHKESHLSQDHNAIGAESEADK